jgi:hypothetical protein
LDSPVIVGKIGQGIVDPYGITFRVPPWSLYDNPQGDAGKVGEEAAAAAAAVLVLSCALLCGNYAAALHLPVTGTRRLTDCPKFYHKKLTL